MIARCESVDGVWPRLVHDNYPPWPGRQLTASSHKQTTGVLYRILLHIAILFWPFSKTFLLFFSPLKPANACIRRSSCFCHVYASGRFFFCISALFTLLAGRTPLLSEKAVFRLAAPYVGRFSAPSPHMQPPARGAAPSSSEPSIPSCPRFDCFFSAAEGFFSVGSLFFSSLRPSFSPFPELYAVKIQQKNTLFPSSTAFSPEISEAAHRRQRPSAKKEGLTALHRTPAFSRLFTVCTRRLHTYHRRRPFLHPCPFVPYAARETNTRRGGGRFLPFASCTRTSHAAYFLTRVRSSHVPAVSSTHPRKVHGVLLS